MGIMDNKKAIKKSTILQKLKGINGFSISFKEILGWLLTIVLPYVVFVQLKKYNIYEPIVMFCSILTSAIVMWGFELYPEFVPAIFILTFSLFAGIAPKEVILSGLSSEVFIMVMSVLCLSVVLYTSGFITRTLLHILDWTRAYPHKFDKCFFWVFALLSPLIPAVISRVDIAARNVILFAKYWNITRDNFGFNRIVISAFTGGTIFGPMFMSASLMNFVLIGFLPLDAQIRFSFAGWTKSSLVAMAVMVIGFNVCHRCFFKKPKTIDFNPNLASDELKAIGPITQREKGILSILTAVIIGTSTYSVHLIPPSWIMFSMAFVAIAFEYLDRKSLQANVNWPILLFIGGIIGISSLMRYFEVDKFVTVYGEPYLKYFGTSLYAFLTVTIVATLLVRLFMPMGAGVAVLFAVFLPIGQTLYNTTWEVGFVILMASDCWFLPYQSYIYTTYKTILMESHIEYNEKKFLYFNACISVIRILAIYASIYYWEYILESL